MGLSHSLGSRLHSRRCCPSPSPLSPSTGSHGGPLLSRSSRRTRSSPPSQQLRFKQVLHRGAPASAAARALRHGAPAHHHHLPLPARLIRAGHRQGGAARLPPRRGPRHPRSHQPVLIPAVHLRRLGGCPRSAPSPTAPPLPLSPGYPAEVTPAAATSKSRCASRWGGAAVTDYKCGVDRLFIDHPSFLEKVWGKTGEKIYGPNTGVEGELESTPLYLYIMPIKYSMECHVHGACVVTPQMNHKPSAP